MLEFAKIPTPLQSLTKPHPQSKLHSHRYHLDRIPTIPQADNPKPCKSHSTFPALVAAFRQLCEACKLSFQLSSCAKLISHSENLKPLRTTPWKQATRSVSATLREGFANGLILRSTLRVDT
jgi:hypothetical protein